MPDFELATWAKAGLVLCIIVVGANLLLGGEKTADPTTIQLSHARDQICRALGDEAGGCAFAGVVAQNLAAGRCGSVDRLLNELRYELKEFRDRLGGIVVGDAQEGAAVAEKVLQAIYVTRCPMGDASGE